MPAWLQLMIDSFWPLLSAGLIFTVPLTLITFVLGILLGFLVALARLYGPTPLVALVRCYVWLVRGTPLLVQLFLIFYGLPSAGIVLDASTAAVIGFTLNIGAYSSEIIRATLAAIPKGQWEAGWAYGFSFLQTFRLIIFPQMMRFALPGVANNWLVTLKATALVSIIGLADVVKATQNAGKGTFHFFLFTLVAAAIYLLFTTLSNLVFFWLARRYGAGVRGAQL